MEGFPKGFILWIVYGDSENCFVCGVLKELLSKSKLNYRFYELNQDYTLDEVLELYSVDSLPVILYDGKIMKVKDLENVL